MKKRYKFKGWDFVELLKCFEIKVPEKCKDDGIKLLQKYLRELWEVNPFEKKRIGLQRLVCRRVRKFLNLLAKQSKGHSYYSPVWKTIASIKDDGEMLRLVIPLIGFMWD